MKVESKRLNTENLRSKVTEQLTKKIDHSNVAKELFPKGKPSNDVDTAVVTLDEKEYQRLREIEDGIKQLFQLAFKVEGVVAFGRVKPGFKEPKLIMKLRELTGEKRYEPIVVENEKKTKGIVKSE